MLNTLHWRSWIRGGVHPKEYHKDSSAALPIHTLPLPPRLFLPLRQHAGADAIPVVKVGDAVAKGQLLALAPSAVSAPVHASSSGTVVAIEDVVAPHASGMTGRAIVIECDGLDRWLERPEPADPFTIAPMVLADQIAAAGVVGMGGAIFPAAVKLKQGARHEVKTLLINGSECEPYLTCDDRLMRERAEQVIDGARIVRHILKAYKIVVAIEDNKPEAIAAMRAAAEPFGAVEVKVVPTRYPMGSAKQLITAVTGREVPAGARSTTVGVLVHNVGTVYAIHRTLRYGEPLVSRIVTVAGDCISRPRNYEALIGTPISWLLDHAEIKAPPARLILGGPMMGVPLTDAQAPVIKGATGVLALSQQQVPADEVSPCIRCSRCVEACPMGLLPLDMAAHARADDFDGADAYGLTDCILCGACAYVCPSHIPLTQYFQYAQGEQDARKVAAKKNDYTLKLTQARQERQEREAAERAAAKASKKRPSKQAEEEA
jgi:Na+-translocating ferredoxin:NAD+ oxidoreductase subunit C